MKHYLQLLGGLAVCALLLFGCSESNPSSPGSPTVLGSPPPGGIQFKAPAVPFNSNNPLDSMGLVHNEAIVYALQWVNDTTLDGNMDSLLVRFNEGMKEYYVSNDFLTNSEFDSVWTSQIGWCENNQTELLDPTTLANYQDDGLSPLAVWYLNRIGKVLTADESDSSVTLDSLSQIEDEITTIAWDDSSAFSVYSTISVAKYSYHLWNSIAQDAQAENDGVPVWSNQDVCTFALFDTKQVVKSINIDSNGKVSIEYELQFDIHSWWAWLKQAATDAWNWLKAKIIGLL